MDAKQINAVDLARADAFEAKSELNVARAAILELQSSLEQLQYDAQMAREAVAVLLHREGEVFVELSEKEKRAAWLACRLRVRMDVIKYTGEEAGKGNAVRLSLVPVTPEELAEDAAAAASIKTEETASEKGAEKENGTATP